MGCGDSKIKNINLSPDPDDHIEMTKTSPDQKIETITDKLDDGLPNRLLSAIPISDLGESLDSRHLSESFNGALGKMKSGADSVDSNDSGYDEYDEEYNHIITENSEPHLVKKVEQDFIAADLPELLVITGRACTRILSGYQKSKAEEAKILESLREEGLLAKPKGKTAGGLAFEVVDSSVVEKQQDHSEGKDAFVTAEFIPSKTLKRLELRRGTIKKTSLKLETKLAEAELRRKELEEERVKAVLERSGLERHGRMRSASAMKREQQYSATVAKRQAQLQDMRDKLKEKHKKNDMIKLKKQLQFGGSSTATPNSSARFDSGFAMQGLTTGARDFFDD